MLKIRGSILVAAALLTGSVLFSAPASAADGETLYKFYCAQCHGVDGKGDGPNVTKSMPVTPRNFANTAEMNKLSDADLSSVIVDGGPAASKSPIMPAWSKTLSKDETGKLVAHLRKMCNCKGK
jgi:cytochrome c oxidase cbb3-type subunit III